MVNPECIDWYGRHAAQRWKAQARTELNRQMDAAPAEDREGYLLALDKLEEMPAPVDLKSFVQTCNERAVQFYRKAFA